MPSLYSQCLFELRLVEAEDFGLGACVVLDHREWHADSAVAD